MPKSSGMTEPGIQEWRFGPRARSYAWLMFTAALFLLQVLPYISYRWVTDESWYAGPAYSLAHGQGIADPEIGPNDLEHFFDTRPPGTALVMAASFRGFGTSVATARLGSVVAGLLVLLLTWHLTRPLLGEAGAAIAVLVTGTDNLLVTAARTARPEALTTMAVLFALVAMSRYHASTSPRRWLWALGSGLLAASAAMCHVTMAGYAVSLGLLAIAIDRKRGETGVRGPALLLAGFLLGLVPFATWIMTNPLGPRSFHAEYLQRAAGDAGLTARLISELQRYKDVLGLGMLHGHGLQYLPVRLPIPLAFLFAMWLLWRFGRRWFYLELVLLLPTLLWMVETVNKSSRYFALIAPVLGFAFGAASAASRSHPRLHRAALLVSGFVIAAQFGANLLLLRAAQKADYNHTGALLNAAIPPGEPVYGTIAFWLAMRDRTFISQERTTPETAMRDDGVHYFILGDRTMAEGTWDPAFTAIMRRSLRNIALHGTMVREIADPYYGDLRVYRMP